MGHDIHIPTIQYRLRGGLIQQIHVIGAWSVMYLQSPRAWIERAKLLPILFHKKRRNTTKLSRRDNVRKPVGSLFARLDKTAVAVHSVQSFLAEAWFDDAPRLLVKVLGRHGRRVARYAFFDQVGIGIGGAVHAHKVIQPGQHQRLVPVGQHLVDAIVDNPEVAVQTFFRVVLPIVRPGLWVTALFSLLLSYNEFLFALVLTGPHTKTLPVAIAEYGGEDINYWSLSAAAAIGIMLPIVAFMTLMQRHLVRGVAFGAVK